MEHPHGRLRYGLLSGGMLLAAGWIGAQAVHTVSLAADGISGDVDLVGSVVGKPASDFSIGVDPVWIALFLAALTVVLLVLSAINFVHFMHARHSRRLHDPETHVHPAPLAQHAAPPTAPFRVHADSPHGSGAHPFAAAVEVSENTADR